MPFLKSLSPPKSFVLAFFLGPIVMSSMYYYMIFMSHPAIQMRCLCEFYSVLFGDFIILPMCWAIISTYYRDINKYFNLQFSKKLMRIGLGLGILFTTTVVVSGVYGNQRDWTIPIKGTINVPGIYHALFMALMISSFIIFFIQHWTLSRFQYNDLPQETIYRFSTLVWNILNLLTAFFVLLWVDRLYEKNGSLLSADPIQEIGWGIFIIFNIYYTFRFQHKPYKSNKKWVVFQISWWTILFSVASLLI